MKLLNVKDFIEARKKGQRRSDLYRTENLQTWLLYFPPGDVQRFSSHATRLPASTGPSASRLSGVTTRITRAGAAAGATRSEPRARIERRSANRMPLEPVARAVVSLH